MEPEKKLTRDEALEAFLTDRIKEYNNNLSPSHRAIRQEGAVSPFYAVFRDAQGEVEGALWGESFWGWFEVEKLWVREDRRRSGLGSLLMDACEAEARVRGCQAVFLTTFGFQAPDFYQARGYRILGTRENYPPGVTYYWLQKDLG